MKRFSVPSAVALVALCVGVVRPHSVRMAEEGWVPVVQKMQRIPFTLGRYAELPAAGDYVVFVDAPASDPMWSNERGPGVWAELIDFSSHQALRRKDADFGYAFGDRRGLALSRVTAPTADRYELQVTSGHEHVEDLEARGVEITIGPAEPVTAQATSAMRWIVAGFGACALLGGVALMLLMKQDT